MAVGILKDRVVVVTGAGRGLGRAHALLAAAEGAQVVVNDLGDAADQVVEEITQAGGRAIASNEPVNDWEAARRIVRGAVEAFGDLHVVVNNAGILRDRMLVSMSEEDFDTVVDVHLKGTFCVSRWAADYWRGQAKAGSTADRALINTTSASGLHGNVGQANYSAAKAGIAAMTLVGAAELARYGVRSNCIAPVARTRLTAQTPGMDEAMTAAEKAEGFGLFAPENVSPLVVALAAADCTVTGQAFSVFGGAVGIYDGWAVVDEVYSADRWEPGELRAALDAREPAARPLHEHTLRLARALAPQG